MYDPVLEYEYIIKAIKILALTRFNIVSLLVWVRSYLFRNFLN